MGLYYLLIFLEQFHDYPHLGVKLFTTGIIIITPVKLAGIATLAAALILPRPRDAARRIKSAIGPLYFGFAALSVLSLIVWSLPLGNSLSVSFLISFALLLPASRLLVCSETRLRNVVRVMVLSAAFSTLWAFREHLAGIQRAFGVSNDPNYYALVLVTIFPLSLWMARCEVGRSWRRAGAVAAAMLAIAVLFTQSRGGVVALGVVALPEILRLRHRPVAMLGVAAAIAALVVVASPGVLQRFRGVSLNPTAREASRSNEESVEIRLEFARAAWKMIQRHPLVGIGLDRFWSEGPSYNPDLGDTHGLTHDTYLQTAAETGIPALVLFLLIMAVGFSNCRAAARLCSGSPIGHLAGSMREAILGFAVGAAFLTAWYIVPYWVILFLSQNLKEIAGHTARNGGRSTVRGVRPPLEKLRAFGAQSPPRRERANRARATNA